MSDNDHHDAFSGRRDDRSASAGQTQPNIPAPTSTSRPSSQSLADPIRPQRAEQATVGGPEHLSHPLASHHTSPPSDISAPPPQSLPSIWTSLNSLGDNRGHTLWNQASTSSSHEPVTNQSPTDWSSVQHTPHFIAQGASGSSFQSTTNLPFSYAAVDSDSSSSDSPDNMSRNFRRPANIETNARARPAISHKRLQRQSDDAEASTSAKRARQDDADSSAQRKTSDEPEVVAIENVDENDAMERTLARQRQDQVRAATSARNGGDERRFLTKLTCVICLEPPTNLTSTSCGHLFCHECIMQSLIHAETLPRQNGEPKRTQCPVCRKSINRAKGKELIPLKLMKGLATQPRRKKTG